MEPSRGGPITARVLRIGQEQPVTVHIPLTKLPNGQRSFDENLHALLERKRSLMHDALLPPELDFDELPLCWTKRSNKRPTQ